jgi:large subunit ribosomal protein L18e
MSRINRPPVSLSKLAVNMKGQEGKTAVVVGTITNDARLIEIPKMKVCALRFTDLARTRIVAAGGECMTFDQLALKAPKGQNTILLQGTLLLAVAVCLAPVHVRAPPPTHAVRLTLPVPRSPQVS